MASSCLAGGFETALASLLFHLLHTHNALVQTGQTSLRVLQRSLKHLHTAENKRYARWMPTAEYDTDAVRRQLERVLASAGFSRNERLARFLRFVVEQHLEGRDSEIKESVIAIEVFGRGADHDPKQNSIVRNEAARLRARLNEYYVGEGKYDPLLIELPKGGYTPVLRDVRASSATTAPAPAVTPSRAGTRLRLSVALAGIAVAVGGAAWWLFQHQNAPIPIAVLPLANLSQDPANDYFADGLTDEVIRNLSIIEGLAVRSQTSSFALKGKPRNLREAGKQLEADYILEGSVLRTGQQLRINVQLVRVRDDFPLWSGRYDRELPDILAIQDEISRGIVNSLRLKLGRGRRRYEISSEVYDLYLRARAIVCPARLARYKRQYRSAGGRGRERLVFCPGLRGSGRGVRSSIR